MKLLLICAVITVQLCLSIDAYKSSKHRNNKEVYHKKHMDDIEAKLAQLQLEEDEDEEYYDEEDQNDQDEDLNSPILDEDVDDQLYDPCQDKYCGAGRECIITDDGEGVCQCVPTCDVPVDDRRKVCSNQNETWPSDCELYRQRCVCLEDQDECTSAEYKHVHIDYYGHCQELKECSEGEIEDFPRRITEWLFNVMRDMADRQMLSEHYLSMEKKAEGEDDETKKWTYAVVWKWCELDGFPKDRSISRHELFPLRAPLYTLEHCIAPFLDSCDSDNNHLISLNEWAKCLKLDDKKMVDLEDMCEEIRD